MTEKNLSKLMGLAINDYEMIKDGDRIVIGLSGGIDSLALLLLLYARLDRIPIKYKLFPVFVDNFNGENSLHNERIEKLRTCVAEKTGLSMDIIKITAVKILTDENFRRRDTCFLCSRKRRTELIKYASGNECSSIALGHHMDDIVETSLMNMFYGRELSSMLPRLDIFGGKMSLIRPLCYISKPRLESFIYGREEVLPVFGEVCPSKMIRRDLRREKVRDMIKILSPKIPGFSKNIFAAFRNPKPDYLLDRFFSPKSSGLFKRP